MTAAQIARICAADLRITEVRTLLDGVESDLHGAVLSDQPMPDDADLMARAQLLLAEVAQILTGTAAPEGVMA